MTSYFMRILPNWWLTSLEWVPISRTWPRGCPMRRQPSGTSARLSVELLNVCPTGQYVKEEEAGIEVENAKEGPHESEDEVVDLEKIFNHEKDEVDEDTESESGESSRKEYNEELSVSSESSGPSVEDQSEEDSDEGEQERLGRREGKVNHKRKWKLSDNPKAKNSDDPLAKRCFIGLAQIALPENVIVKSMDRGKWFEAIRNEIDSHANFVCLMHECPAIHKCPAQVENRSYILFF